MSLNADSGNNLDDEMARESETDLVATEKLLQQTLGGSRGLIDSALPTVAFLTTFTLTSQNLQSASIAAGAAAVGLVGLRLIQRKSLQQVFSGVIGVAIAIWFTRNTGKAEDFFLPGLLTNAAYAVGITLSIIFRNPFLGFVVGGLKGDLLGWRKNPRELKFYSLISWWWVGMFSVRLAVQLPLYFAAQLELLGTAKLIMGWPLYLAVVWITYRAVKARDELDS
jgi:hypothetical protein